MTIARRIGVGFALSILPMGIVAVAAFRSTRELIDNSSGVAHTHEVLEQLQKIIGVGMFSAALVAGLWTLLVAFEFNKMAEKCKRAEDSLRNAKQDLESSNRELEAFSYSVSHDLRAPLRGIDGFSQALLEDQFDKLDEQGREYLQRVRAASQRMAQLIDDLIDLSKVTRTTLRREPVDLTALARSVAADLRSKQPDRSAEFIIQDGLSANADPRLMRMVFANLLGNSWKFTAKKTNPSIEFGSIGQNCAIAFFVRDDGAGFDMRYSDKLFGVFQRLHRMDDFPGTGVGLATVQRIIRRHGGRVWADGEVGAGATFYFTLSGESEGGADGRQDNPAG